MRCEISRLRREDLKFQQKQTPSGTHAKAIERVKIDDLEMTRKPAAYTYILLLNRIAPSNFIRDGPDANHCSQCLTLPSLST